MCSWVPAAFVECQQPHNHKFQMGLKCADAMLEEQWCEEEKMTELHSSVPSSFENVQIPCPYCNDYRFRFVDRP
jgi:hypothetical protein